MGNSEQQNQEEYNHQPGDQVGGDKITVGDVTDSIVAAGAGAIVTVQKGLTVEEVATLVLELKREDQPTVWDGR